MQVGDLITVDDNAGIITAVYWDDEENVDVARIQFSDGTWALEREFDIEVVNESR